MTTQTDDQIRYSVHDTIWLKRGNLHGNIYWEDAQLIGDAVYAKHLKDMEKKISDEIAKMEDHFGDQLYGTPISYRDVMNHLDKLRKRLGVPARSFS